MHLAAATRATPGTWAGLAVLLLPALLVSMDISVLFVAAPAITEDLRPSATQWLWMMDIYGFVMAGLLITMGGLGDRLGRRRVLLIGAAVFGLASVVIALSTTPATLIAARALLGIGAATLAPSTFSLIRSMFTDEGQRRAAIGAWTVAFTGGAVAGPIVGGFLLEHFWWGSVFLINVPVMVLLLISAPVLIGESRGPKGAGFDALGAAVSLSAILSLVFGVKHITEFGMDTTSGAALLTALILLAGFLARQRRARHPLIDLELFRRPAFSAAVGANTVVSFAAAGLGLLVFTLLQTVYGLSPLRAALWALPTFVGTLLGAVVAGLLAKRVRPVGLLPAGLLIGAAGFGVVASADGLIALIGGYTVLTLGIGIVGTLANSLVLSTAPAERAGAASGISETSSELGAALGIATLGTVAGAVYRAAMPTSGSETVSAAVATAESLPRSAADQLVEQAFTAYTDGVAAASLTGVAVLSAVALLVAVGLRKVPR